MTPHRVANAPKMTETSRGPLATSLDNLLPEARTHAGFSEAQRQLAGFRQQTSLRGPMSLLP